MFKKIDTRKNVCYDLFTERIIFLFGAYNIWNVLGCPSGPGSFYFGGIIYGGKRI